MCDEQIQALLDVLGDPLAEYTWLCHYVKGCEVRL